MQYFLILILLAKQWTSIITVRVKVLSKSFGVKNWLVYICLHTGAKIMELPFIIKSGMF
jgi:hypothetical protein